MPAGPIHQRTEIAIAEAIGGISVPPPEMIQFERRIAAETEHEPAIGEAFLAAGPRRMKDAFCRLSAPCGRGGRACHRGCRTGRWNNSFRCAREWAILSAGSALSVSAEDRQRRIIGAVDVFLAAYGAPGARSGHR